MGNGVSSSPREMEKGGVKACPFAGIIQIKFNGFSQNQVMPKQSSNTRHAVTETYVVHQSSHPKDQSVHRRPHKISRAILATTSIRPSRLCLHSGQSYGQSSHR